MPHSLIIADVHLQTDSAHPINQAFMQFIDQRAKQAQALYILGDLFEMWVGDDIGLEVYAQPIAKLRALTEAGIDVFIQYGNRDFLMRDAFIEATGVTLLEEIEVVTLYQQPYLLLHGDLLCTDDTAFQRLRKIVRSPIIQWLFLRLSRQRRWSIGEKMRHNSQSQSHAKPAEIMDVNHSAVEQLFAQHPQVEHMIHGHTHRPAHHQVNLAGKPLHRWVLGDWRPEAKIIQVTADGPALIDFQADTP